MVDACDQSGKPDSAILYLQKLNTLFPSDHNITLKTGLLAEKYKKPDIAILSYSQLIDHSKYDKNVLHEKRADQYTEIKEYSKAKNDYQNIEPINPVQTKRVESKEKEVDVQIKANKRAVDHINHLEATDIQKVTMADQLLQIGQTAKAYELLKTISESSPVAKQAEPLKQEAQLKINPTLNIPVPASTLTANPRLKTEVLKRNAAVIKQN
jgi:tetratricopeptide (TPR) repeat protein